MVYPLLSLALTFLVKSSTNRLGHFFNWPNKHMQNETNFEKGKLLSEFETAAMVEGVQTITSKKQLLQEYDFMIIRYTSFSNLFYSLSSVFVRIFQKEITLTSLV